MIPQKGVYQNKKHSVMKKITWKALYDNKISIDQM